MAFEKGGTMEGEEHGTQDEGAQAAQATQDAQGQEPTQEEEALGAAADASADARDARIAELEAQVAEAARSAQAAEGLRAEIAQLRQQAADDRVDFELRLAGARNLAAARAVLAEHDGDVAKLKEAEPWLFAAGGAAGQAEGATGLPNAGAAHDEGKTIGRWRRLAGLEQD